MSSNVIVFGRRTFGGCWTREIVGLVRRGLVAIDRFRDDEPRGRMLIAPVHVPLWRAGVRLALAAPRNPVDVGVAHLADGMTARLWTYTPWRAPAAQLCVRRHDGSGRYPASCIWRLEGDDLAALAHALDWLTEETLPARDATG